MHTSVKLQIAGIIILLKSSHPLINPAAGRKNNLDSYRFDNFLYQGKKRADIVIEARIVERLPRFSSGENIFITRHFEDNQENWRIIKKGTVLIFSCPMQDEERVAFIGGNFSRAVVYILHKPHEKSFWELSNIADNFLQILLINYLADRKLGFFAHGVGIREHNGTGLLFCGRSGAGKSTTARIWSKNSKAKILNDDRVIVRTEGKGYRLYSSPWTGEFYRYLQEPLLPASFRKLFFIYHEKKNTIARIGAAQAFRLLYPTIFPAFWDKRYLENTAGFCHELVQKVACYHLGFVNNKKIIGFVRKIGRSKKQ